MEDKKVDKIDNFQLCQMHIVSPGKENKEKKVALIMMSLSLMNSTILITSSKKI